MAIFDRSPGTLRERSFETGAPHASQPFPDSTGESDAVLMAATTRMASTRWARSSPLEGRFFSPSAIVASRRGRSGPSITNAHPSGESDSYPLSAARCEGVSYPRPTSRNAPEITRSADFVGRPRCSAATRPARSCERMKSCSSSRGVRAPRY